MVQTTMVGPPRTAIVTGASRRIGAGIANALVDGGFNVVANSSRATQSTELSTSDRVALVDGDIGEAATTAQIVETALARFRSLDESVRHAACTSSLEGVGIPLQFVEKAAGLTRHPVGPRLTLLVEQILSPGQRQDRRDARHANFG